MRRAVLAVSVLALVAGIGSARADTPAPRAPSVLTAAGVGEARLEWPAVTDYAEPGGTLGDPSGLAYSVEALGPGDTVWTVITTTTATTYTAQGLRPGVWKFRVRCVLWGGAPGAPSPEVSKTVK